jgi:uncharacterized protein
LATRLGDDRVLGTVAIWLAVCAVVVMAARMWLRWFDRGPVEWLWHRSHDLLTGRQVRQAGRRHPGP